jgi:hypothetical protein
LVSESGKSCIVLAAAGADFKTEQNHDFSINVSSIALPIARLDKKQMSY